MARLHPKGVLLFQASGTLYMKEISIVEGAQNMCFLSVKRSKRANMHFMAVKKLTKRSGFVIY